MGRKLGSKADKLVLTKKGSKGIILLLLLLAITQISGCWDQLELENRALVLGMAIDEAPPGAESKEEDVSHLEGRTEIPESRMIQITAQVAVPGRIALGPSQQQEGQGEENSPVWILTVVGHTVEDAMNNLQQQVADEKFLNHLRVVVISEPIAKHGIEDINDYFHRNAEVRRTTWLLVTKGEAAAVMSVSPPLERVPTLYLLSMLEHSVEMGKFPSQFIGVFWNAASKKGQEGFLPYIEIRQKDNIYLSGLAYFRGEKMVGISKAIHIGAYMAVKGMNPGGYPVLYTVPEIGPVMVKVTERKSRVAIRLKDGKPHVQVYIRLQGELQEVFQESTAPSKPVDLHLIEEALQEGMNREIAELVENTRKIRSDIFGFGEHFRAKKPEYWNQHIRTKEEWQRIYGSELTYEIDARLYIRRVGMKAK